MIIFTDLDGTLLNHHTYDYKVVLPILQRLKSLQIPVILNSSKTLTELEEWQNKLELNTPMIAENGGVMRISSNQEPFKKVQLGVSYTHIRAVLEQLRAEFAWQFEGFGDWSLAEVMNHTQLHSTQALKAVEREASEPILWLDSNENLAAFKSRLAEHQLTLKQGGRFYHVMGHHDKATAMKVLLNQFYDVPSSQVVVALGDSENDRDMLDYADYAIVIPNNPTKIFDYPSYFKIAKTAPEGWLEAMEKLLAHPTIASPSPLTSLPQREERLL